MINEILKEKSKLESVDSYYIENIMSKGCRGA
jgi:hypothetical protein